MTENLSLRCTPTLHFISRGITFRNQLTAETTKQTLKSCVIKLPISIKVATKRLNNYRPYLLAGFSANYDLAHESETPVVFNRLDFSLHIALGTDTYLPFFKFCPELRFNLGLADMLDHVRNDIKTKRSCLIPKHFLRPRTRASRLSCILNNKLIRFECAVLASQNLVNIHRLVQSKMM